MEIVLVVAVTSLTISLFANFMMVRTLKKLLPNVGELYTATLEAFEGCNCNCVPSLPSVEEEPSVAVAQAPKESYQAWKNMSYEPTKAPPSPHKPPPVSEPMARPGGFAL